MQPISRRQFVVEGGAALAFASLPVPPFVASLAGESIDERTPIQHLSESGANLLFYFVNTVCHRDQLVPRSAGEPSYMIVQLPPQSLHEEYFHSPTGATPTQQLRARLSGPSFLVFRLWPNWSGAGRLPRGLRIPYELSAFLEWTDADRFALQTADGVEPGEWKPLGSPQDVGTVTVTPEDLAGAAYDLSYYHRLARQVSRAENPASITILELPAGILMTLIDPRRTRGVASNVLWRVTQNRPLPRRATIREQRYEIRTAGSTLVRTVSERWSAQIGVVPREAHARADVSADALPPALRAIGLVRTPKPEGPQAPDRPDVCEPTQYPPTPPGPGYLPTLLDAAELVYLTQLGSEMHADSRFDIRGDGPFRLTDLGASLKFHYKNYDTRGLPGSISLVEYEHHFEAGRDNFIRIARIGLCPLTTLRTLHVAIAQRKVQDGVSFMEYKEYLEPFEPLRTFPKSAGNVPYPAGYVSAVPDAGGTKWLRHPFSRVEVALGRSPPIEPVLASEWAPPDPRYLDPRAFWAYREGRPGDRSEANLLRMPHTFYDRNEASLGVKDVAILFLRRDFFCNTALVDQWLHNDGSLQSLRMWDDGRLRVMLGGDVVGLTYDDPQPATPNKPNQMGTDWVDYYFDVARFVPASRRNPFDHEEFATYPQVRQARVYIDLVQQYAQAKRPSIVAYEDDYLRYGLEVPLVDASGVVRPDNAAKLILAHTADFKADQVKFLGGTRIDEREPDLKAAWDKILRSFKDAGESLGALVNPDPALDRISLTKSALSLPATAPVSPAAPMAGPLEDPVQAAIRANSLDPRMLFKGVDAELFAGIKLSDVLEALELDQAPQYLLNKLPQLPDSAAIVAAIAENPLVRAAYDVAGAIDDVVKQAERRVREARETLAQAEALARSLKAQLDEALPTRAKIEAAARAQLEAAALARFEKLTEAKELRALAALEVGRVLQETGVAGLAESLTGFLTRDAPAAADALLKSYEDTVGTASQQYKELAAEFHQFGTRLRPLTDWYPAVGRLIEQPTLNGAALKELSDAVELTGNRMLARAKLAESVFRLYELFKPRLPPGEAARWRDALAKLDAARRLHGVYLQQRFARLAQEAEDACRTLPPDIFGQLGTLEGVWREGEARSKALLDSWDLDPTRALALAQDPKERRKYLERAITAALRSLPATRELERQLANQQSEVVEQLSILTDFTSALEEKLRDQAKGFAKRFLDEFTRVLATVRDSDQARQAVAAYGRVVQLLNAVRVQELTTDWTTSKFQAVELGFLRFEPRSAPDTRLTMRAGVRMEMDPFSNPPLAVRTEAYAETLITSFRVTFLNIIAIDFERVSFTSGTGKSTNADVKITGVEFAGSFSFIQALQELLSGLVDGLRVELGTDHVTVGYQSPSLDLSSPGFTFSNFSVGVSLVVSFDRKPVRLRFALAEPEKKATIAAGIYGGCFFCALLMDTKRGIIGTDMALEMGAYFGIRFGPFSGYVKFMAGLRYTRDDEGVTLVGYFIAEGALSVWVITVSARLYMGIRSHNSVAEGFCIASYRVKVGFFKKTFTAGYTKRLAGASQNTPNGQTRADAARGLRSAAEPAKDEFSVRMLGEGLPMEASRSADPSGALRSLLRDYPETLVDDFQPLSAWQFREFQRQHFATVAG